MMTAVKKYQKGECLGTFIYSYVSLHTQKGITVIYSALREQMNPSKILIDINRDELCVILLTVLMCENCFQIEIYRVRTVMENLGKSWNFKMVISRPGEVMKKTNHKSFGNVMEIC